MDISDRDAELIAALRQSLPLEARPYALLGESLGMPEAEVLERLARLRGRGVIRRFGAIVRHHELGFRANGMCVFDVPDHVVGAIGRRAARAPAVTLCYRRRRAQAWPYNLYCMIHGQDRNTVRRQYEELARHLGLADAPRQILFSRRRFKQTGGCYGRAHRPAAE